MIWRRLRVVRVIILIAMLTAGVMPAQADLAGESLASLQMDAWRARMGFHLLSIRGNNPDDQAALDQLLSRGEQRIKALQASASTDAETRLVAQLQTGWQALSERARDNPLATLGYADYGAMSEMNTTTLTLDRLLKNTDLGTAGPYLDIYRLAVDMQKLASEYLALAAFPSAGLPTGTSLAPMDFAVAASDIDKRLAKLQLHYQENAGGRETLAFIQQRWAFIRGSVPKMNDQSAARIPYLFYRYSTQVADRVEALGA
nr:hypothetical protein [Alcanivorax hongdengensis]